MRADFPPAELLRRQVQSLFPPGVVAGVARIGETAPLIDAEGNGLARMVPARQAEFIAGRLALRRAQAELGVPPFALINGPDRSPQWPDGYCGSISHAGGVAVVALCHSESGFGSLGLDIEEDRELSPELQENVLLPLERAALARCDHAGRQARLIFCVKECVYKAQYMFSRQLFGFEVIAVTLSDGAFMAQFMADMAPFRAGDCLKGRYVFTNGLVIAGMALRDTQPR